MYILLQQTIRILFLKLHDFGFDNRNTSYGAYSIRKKYDSHVLAGLLISVLFLLLLLLFVHFGWQKKTLIMSDLLDQKSTLYSSEVIRIEKEDAVKKSEKPKSSPVIKPVEKTVTKTESRLTISENQDTKTPATEGNAGESVSEGNETGDTKPGMSSDTSGTDPFSDEVYIRADQNAYPKGGYDVFHQFIKEHINYPEFAFSSKVDGIVYLQAVVNINGTLSELKVVRGIEHTCDTAAIQALRLSPNWIPARLKGKSVRQKVLIPIYIRPLK